MIMSTNAIFSAHSSSIATEAVAALYHTLLACWNQRNATAYADCFTEAGNVVGFDGSQLDGRTTIATELSRIFANHQTATYVAKVREVRVLGPDVVLLRAVVGMAPPGQQTINPAVNAIQSLVAVCEDRIWRIALFHNTPAAFHGRPELSAALTAELQQALST